MISHNRTIIAIALVAILLIALFARYFITNHFIANNKIEIAKNIIEIETKTNDVIFYTIPGKTPLVEIAKGGKIQKSYNSGDISFKEKHGQIIYVGIPEGNYTVDLETVSGNISGSAKTENLSLSTISGNIDAEHIASSTLELSTISGKVQIGKVEAKKLKLSAISGKVALSNYDVKSGKINTVSGSVELNTAQEVMNYDLESVTGNINSSLTLDKESVVKLNINTVSGNIIVNKLL